MLHSDLSVIQLQCNDIALGEYISGRGDALRRGSIESRAILGAVSLVAVFCHPNFAIAILVAIKRLLHCVSAFVTRAKQLQTPIRPPKSSPSSLSPPAPDFITARGRRHKAASPIHRQFICVAHRPYSMSHRTTNDGA